MFRIVAPSCCAASLLFLSAGCDSAPQAVTASTVPDDVPAIQVPAATADWPGWRGPQGNGVADANQSPPLHWSKTENVLWKATIPGKGHSSPTVVNDQVFLTTADAEAEVQTVLSFDRQTGEPRWRTDVHTGGLDTGGHAKTSQASSPSQATVEEACEVLACPPVSSPPVWTSVRQRGLPVCRSKLRTV